MSLIPKKGTIYIVDDDEAVRDSLQWLLEGKDYNVRCYDSAETFLSRYDPREVACLIVDIRMGGMSGLELQDKLIERKSPLPIVFITGHGDVPMAVSTMKKGAMDFIQKPFKEEELLALVERMLETAKDSFAEYQQAANRDALLAKLTGREAQVLERIVAADSTSKLPTIWASASKPSRRTAPTSWKSSTPTRSLTCSKPRWAKPRPKPDARNRFVHLLTPVAHGRFSLSLP